ncbi:MAG TPA: phosphatase PAP2 family protein [Xanthobacteraceae bacterium]|nr:phosphatase PAP2 family protein [Xanthobacteraceae bacterium]
MLASALRTRAALAHFSTAELAVVRLFCAERTMSRALAIGLSWMGNGWIYLALIPLCLMRAGWRAAPVVGAAAINTALLHLLYPRIKKWISRPRPFRADARLQPLLPTLDEFSFPSGHVMTITAALVPIVAAFPGALLPSVALWMSMGWARIASAHHYPSDLIAGGAIGAAVSYPITICILGAF